MNAQDMDWDDLRFILAVCRHGTLSGAARELSVNHSTVFRRVGTIEQKLGIRLFERLPTGYVMTKASEAIFQSAETIETEIFTLSRKLIGGDMRLNGALYITAPDALTIEVLMPYVAQFGKRYPEIDLNFTVENRYLDLSMRQSDVAIRSTKNPPETAIGKRLCTLGVTLYASSQYLAEHGKIKISNGKWLMPDKSEEWFSANRWLESHYPEATVAFRSNTLLALFEATKLGMGIAPLPCFLADPETSLQRIMVPPEEFCSELWLLTHPDLKRTARVRAFVDFIRDAIEDVRPRLEGSP